MGAKWFYTSARGRDIREAYNTAVEDATEEYGYQDGYSGEINSVNSYKDVTRDFKASGKSLDSYLDMLEEELGKYDGARAICIEEPKLNSNKIKTQVEHVVTPGTKKWMLRYVVYDSRGERITGAPTKGEAVKLARQHSERTQSTSMIRMEKHLEKSDTALVAKVKYKPAASEKYGKWIFFGWAPY